MFSRLLLRLPPAQSRVFVSRAVGYNLSTLSAKVVEETPHLETSEGNSTVDFDNVRPFKDQSNFSLLAGYAVLLACKVPFLVNNSEKILVLSTKVFGVWFTTKVVKVTLFHQFCGGETEQELIPVIKDLQSKGIFPILDYSTETEPDEANRVTEDTAHLENFNDAVTQLNTVANHVEGGISPIKATAFCSPSTLKQLSSALTEARSREIDVFGFGKSDESKTKLSEDRITEKTKQLEEKVSQSHELIADGKVLAALNDPFGKAVLRDLIVLNDNVKDFDAFEEIESIATFIQYLLEIGEKTKQYNLKLAIDAEQSYLQTAIDYFNYQLQMRFNQNDDVFIFNTFQCYLKDASKRVEHFKNLSEKNEFNFGAKLVRGAYMVHERELAKKLGSPSPIHETLQQTHACYNENVRFLLENVKNSNIAIVVATHNENSVCVAIDAMKEMRFSEEEVSRVNFAQLYGMSDSITYALAKSSYKVWKWVPYGPIRSVLPYLIRRVQENSAVLKSTDRQRQTMRLEMWRRLPFFGRNSLS